MAANTGTLKRIPIKHIRDRAKAAYEKDTKCFICDATEELELHHTHGLTNLYDKWIKDTGYIVNSDEDILAIRDEFISTFHKEMYEDVYTLCLKHHRALHSVYGKSPLLNSAPKQSTWILKQKDKHNGIQSASTPPEFVGRFQKISSFGREAKSSPGTDSSGNWFSSFYKK